jgi:predicted RNA-binding protein YlxR (DUF448 family)
MRQASDREQTTTQAGHPGSGTPRVRTCVGCGERVEIPRGVRAPSPLVRLVLGPGGEVAVDAAGGGFGRGAHVHPRPGCLEKAVQRGLARAAKAKVSLLRVDEPAGEGAGAGLVLLDAASLAQAIIRAADRRIGGLLVAAARAQRIAPGSDAVKSADERGEAHAVLVAVDAAAAAELSAVRRAIADGRAISWGTKQTIGLLCSAAGSAKRSEGLGVSAITDSRIAGALQEAVRMASAVTTLTSPRRAHPAGAEPVRKRHDCNQSGGASAEEVARSGQGRRADG